MVYYTPSTGASTTQAQRIKRTVTGTEAGQDRVRISAPLSQSQIQSTNTGSGQVGSGILVDSVNLLGLTDFANVIAGGTLRSVVGLPAGPRVELNEVLFASVQGTNTSDGVVLPGLTVGAGEAQIVSGATTVNLTVRSGTANAFTVTRNLVSTPSTNQVVINQAVATAPVATNNTGDGTTGSEITLSSFTNFISNDLALYNGKPCDDGSVGGVLCSFTLGGSQVRLNNPVASAPLSDTNAGDGSDTNRLEVDDVDNISVGSTVLVNGLTRTVAGVTPAFGVGGKPKVQLDQPLKMTIANTTGDGTSGNGIQVTTAEGFTTGNRVRIRGVERTIAVVPGTPPRIELVGTAPGPVIATTVNAGNTGDGTVANPLSLSDTTGLNTGDIIRFANLNVVRTISGISGNTVRLNTPITDSVQSTNTVLANAGDNTLTLTSTAGFSMGDYIKLPNNDIREITNVAGNVITVNPNLSAAVAVGGIVQRLVDSGGVNLVPATGDILPVGSVASPIRLNLVPKSGSFTMVPNGTLYDNVISRIPTSGSIFLAPQTGILRKYLSIQTNGTNNQNNGDYRLDLPPSKGQ